MSSFANLWYKWKTLRLPWRKQFFAGRDLDGNTYWTFYDLRGGGPVDPSSSPSSPVRMRRIVRYPRGTHPGAVRVPPVWHQWLRHVREAPPTLEEQQQEVAAQPTPVTARARPTAKPPTPEEEGGAQPQPERVVVKAQPQAAAQQPRKPPPPPQPQQPPTKNDPWKDAEQARHTHQAWQPGGWAPPPGTAGKR
ncbi:NADH:ubiquinone oxidoreductase, 17.2kDa subunit [Niveomyces insectorum RCEF 264]|uniref:NADH:ubiquinone oxidoreductase, 17.2kDa subunit n=1 Tax=Niveomyces insectorum RCEF 264 TaxID=1081102 RepID=A0A167UYY3_9HYPO|nr:NADH:ubiquinone oxidoreductase, 17.2kDa subunit [Niveomyces insectorum RCEF 264]